MSEPFQGSLMCVAFNLTPRDWAQCNGQLVSIASNQALFALFGTTYGGDGRVTYGLPNLTGRTPVGSGSPFVLGSSGGQETHTLTQSEVPEHNHSVNALTTQASAKKPNGNSFAGTSGALTLYRSGGNLTALAPQSITQMGGSQAHENRQPYLVLNWIVCLAGIYPSQS